MYRPLRRHDYKSPQRSQCGFTLVELVMVIVIMGVIGGVVAVFMKGPVDAYFALGRRAALSDAADTAVQRISLDTRRALPNSIRVSADSLCMDLIPVKTLGLYRTSGAGALTFAPATANVFNMLGANSANPALAIAANDLVVVNNQGIAGHDAYAGDNLAPVGAVANVVGPPVETAITIAPKSFPTASPLKRFQLVAGSERVVSYACTAAGTLVRAVNAASLAQNCLPGGAIAAGAAVNMLAKNLTSCSFQYTSNFLNDGVLLVKMQMTDSTDSISLQHQVNMDNTP
jgi:MSHA biogenesis protein MshO